jgi:hypothetical protein
VPAARLFLATANQVIMTRGNQFLKGGPITLDRTSHEEVHLRQQIQEQWLHVTAIKLFLPGAAVSRMGFFFR